MPFIVDDYSIHRKEVIQEMINILKLEIRETNLSNLDLVYGLRWAIQKLEKERDREYV